MTKLSLQEQVSIIQKTMSNPKFYDEHQLNQVKLFRKEDGSIIDKRGKDIEEEREDE